MTVCLHSLPSSSTSFRMVSFTPDTVLLCLATVVVSCQVIEATVFAGKEETPQDLPVAEERIFKGKKAAQLSGKKKQLLSLLAHSAQPQVVHTLSPIEHYPIWKVHKYKGIELRPVQVVDVPSPFDYSPVQPEYYQSSAQYGVPAAGSVRTPHAEYGAPVVDYNTFTAPFSGIAKPEQPTTGSDFHRVEFYSPVTAYQGFHHGGKLRTLLAFLRSQGLLTKLRNLKNWKLGLKQGRAPHAGYGFPLPEVQEIPVKGLEHLDLRVPELPTLGLPPYGSAITGGPYVKVQVASPSPVVDYATPEYQSQYAPQYQYQYPPQYSPEYSLSNQYGPPAQNYPERTPAPYYGPPQLYNSYGMPLPADAYSSASSDQVLSFAVPENAQQIMPLQEHQEFNVSNSTLAGVQKVDELPGAKFLSEQEEKNEEEVRKIGEDTVNIDQQTQTNI